MVKKNNQMFILTALALNTNSAQLKKILFCLWPKYQRTKQAQIIGLLAVAPHDIYHRPLESNLPFSRGGGLGRN